jgi:Type III restriction enzyme, res subunit
MPSPEELAREQIDKILADCGWIIQSRNTINLSAGRGVAIREALLKDRDEVDYLLFVDGKAIGTVEAKPEGYTLTGVEEQSGKYGKGLLEIYPKWREPLPFAYESTGVETQFTNRLDPSPKSRNIFAFHRPETLLEFLDAEHQLNNRLTKLLTSDQMPTTNLWSAQIEAIRNLEKSLAANKRRALIQMATGSGKTYTAVNFVYRLIKLAGARRVLFLVDRGNLGDQTLKEFQQTKKRWDDENSKVPPVMITVANRTETAARIKNAFDKGKILIEELCDPKKTLHIDSKVLTEAESRDEEEEIISSQSEDEENGTTKLTKKQQAEYLRKTVDTVGRIGQPGEQIQNVISVGMLSEGWDAKTVTHIMGLRAFSSQLLCEQVVGRGLRRTSYETKPDGLFDAEYVNVFGIPFSFLPHEGDTAPRPPTPPKTRIEALKEREAEFAISWPNIIRIDRTYKRKLVLDLETVEALPLNAAETTQLAELAPVVAGQPDFSKISEIDLQRLAERFRMQKIVFEASRDVYELISPSWQGNKEHLLAQLIGLVQAFIFSGKIDIDPPLFYQDELKRRVMLILNMNKIVQHVFSKIVQDSSEALVPIFYQNKPIRSTADMLAWYSGRPCEPTKKSHINFVVLDSTWESSDAFHLERNEHVQSWVKNDHLGFEIIYIFKGVVHKYWPDFLIRLKSGVHLVLEVKGENDQQAKAKYAALNEWVSAVNQHGGFGTWKSAISTSTTDIGEKIAKAAQATNSSTFFSTYSPF